MAWTISPTHRWVSRVLLVILGLAQAPGLVEGDPGDDRRVIEVAGDRLPHGLLPRPARPGILLPGVGHVLQDQDPRAVGPVEPPGLVGLDVDPQSIQTHRPGDLHVPLEELVVGGRVQPLGIERLVEGGAEVQRFAVEQDAFERLIAVLSPGDGAEAEIGLDAID